MTVNLSINDIINKEYDLTNYRELIENGIFTEDQAKSILIIKNIQENNIILSSKEKDQIKNFIKQHSYNIPDKDYKIDYQNNQIKIMEISENDVESLDEFSYDQIELLTVNSDEDSNIKTCKDMWMCKNKALY